MEKKLLLFCILTTLQTTHTIFSSVCDCNYVKTRGILDINSPYYCQNPSTNHQPRYLTNYTLMTKQNPVKTWKGWTCKQWIKTKKITGSFWIGSFDTVYSQETKLLSAIECWEMVNNKKCGGNLMQAGTTTLSFTSTPTGEGKWYAIKEYHALNCLAEEITLKQETPESFVESPFGFLNTTQQEGEYTQNHNTIVWGDRSTNSSNSQIIFKGEGYIELTNSMINVNTSRLLDNNKQIEITFSNKPDINNKEFAQPGFKVVGMPLTFLIFPNQVNVDTWSCNEYADPIASKVKRSTNNEIEFLDNRAKKEAMGKRLYSISYAWGSIRMGNPIITNVEENGIMTKKDTIAYLMVNGSSINTQVSVHNQYDIQDPLPTGTKFEYIVDHSIRFMNTNICIVANENNQIMAENCTEKTSRWILDLINYQWISLETGLCITLHDEEEGRVRLATLKTCSRQGTISENQQWVIEILTTNPDVLDNFPDASIDEFEEIQLEQRTSVTTTVSSPIFGGLLKRNHGRGNIIWDMIGWGQMKHGKSPDEKCLTHNGVNKPITLEACDPNWIKCQTSLQKLLTSNDPLVQSQTTVANCSEASSKGQAFEYSSDFTIRPFNTNNCIKANTTMLILHECSDKSSIWGTFDHTGQLMASDRTGLHSGASDRKCLTRRIDKLSLGHCHGTSQKQHFSFEYRNPHQPRTLTAAAIISLHTQTRLFGKNLPILPPLNHRDPKEINYKTNATEGITKNSTITTKSATSMTATTDKSVIPSIAAKVTTSAKTETTTTSIRPTTTTTKPTTTFRTTTTKSTTTTKKPTTTTKNPTTTTQKPTTTTQKPTTTTQKPTTIIQKPNTTTLKTTTTTQITASTPKSTTTSKSTTISTEAEKLPTITSTTASSTLTSTSLKTTITTKSSTTTEKASTQQKENTARELVIDDYRPLNDANTSNGLPKSTEELSDLIKYELGKMHEQYKISIETEHDNKLAKEIRDVYCQLSKIKRTQAIILAQTNGLLAAAALGLPMCTRIYGFGQAMTLQQCDPKRISLSAKETKCGFQPFFVYGKNNCTIGLDGWSIHPYSECFWKSQLININGYPHTWQHNATAGDWIKQEATIHTSNLDLIAEFEELHLNSFDYGLRNHPAHGTMEMEQLNILNDLVGRINEGEGKELPDILVTEEQDNQIGNMFSWFDTLKIMALSAIGFILFLICLRIFIACNPIPRIKESFKRRKQSRNVSESDGQEMDSMIPEPIYSAGGANEKPFIREFAPLMTLATETPKETLTSINTPSAPKKGKLYPIEELKWENEQNKECTGSHHDLQLCRWIRNGVGGSMQMYSRRPFKTHN
ncbi:LOW QUALITY PROTEIN: uncharacterized protein LOC123476928 [Daphnia magna]|uniref:LOW QUALITY PROTEIN: uncharacterized protein LOC123476928 n=1 Tax=Daphnia magna TaxID=35525 RepID=UPI001E1BBF43|nr:LOW QUALITY PROTEIN: uncharacterized protein LOC123476928 [Daphnia magna]